MGSRVEEWQGVTPSQWQGHSPEAVQWSERVLGQHPELIDADPTNQRWKPMESLLFLDAALVNVQPFTRQSGSRQASFRVAERWRHHVGREMDRVAVKDRCPDPQGFWNPEVGIWSTVPPLHSTLMLATLCKEGRLTWKDPLFHISQRSVEFIRSVNGMSKQGVGEKLRIRFLKEGWNIEQVLDWDGQKGLPENRENFRSVMESGSFGENYVQF